MIERFNFYDVYGYLIPGAIWLGLLSLPFVLAGAVRSPTATEITVIGLVGGYVAGQLLAGMARKIFPSRKYSTAGGKEQQLSDLLLDPTFKGDKALTPKVWKLLRRHVDQRFKMNIRRKTERKGVFYLCRTALAQGKVGSYVDSIRECCR